MNADSAVFNLAPVAVVLPGRADGMRSTFVGSRFIHQTNRFVMSVIASDDLLATIPETFFIPLDRLQKPL